MMHSLSTRSQPHLAWAHTKHIDYTPDITSDEFWDTHDVVVVRVVGLVHDTEGRAVIRTRVIQQVSVRPMDQAPTFVLSHLWFGPHLEAPPQIGVNDTLVLYIATEGPAPAVATKLDTTPDRSPLVQRLQRIAGLRAGEGGVQALRQAVFDRDPEVARYCLRRLMVGPAFDASSDYVARLRQMRDDETTEPRVRLLVGELLSKLQGKAIEATERGGWLRSSIVQSKQQDWTQIRPFVQALVERGDRSQNVDFLISLALNERLRQAIRIAAYSAFQDDDLFHFAEPDAESNKIFDACIRMLSSRSPLIRRAGAALLYSLSMRIDPRVSGAYAERAESAIRDALSRERNTEARRQLQTYLELLSRRS